MAASNTYKTYLMYKATSESTFTKLIDIVDFPDLRGEPEMLDATTLSDAYQVNIPGILQTDTKQFTANYSLVDYQTIVALEDQVKDYAVYMGADASGTPDGSLGKFVGKGYLSVTPLGGGVNAVRQMRITLAMTEPFELTA